MASTPRAMDYLRALIRVGENNYIDEEQRKIDIEFIDEFEKLNPKLKMNRPHFSVSEDGGEV